ncbi:dockerin [Cellvibrio sp. KY-YJ-3]|uniref:dockerin n=1 Tax=Cellvibrio sp. KY-YJ-3 TaxID=454662 RepID=UPI001CD9F841|nr:dockerin [Cellvibrio sp. KY-YJ-3]
MRFISKRLINKLAINKRSISNLSFLFVFFTSIPVAFAQSNCGTGGGTTVCLSATGSTSSIDLSWTVSGSVSRIELYRDTDSNPAGRTRIAVPATSARSYSDTAAVTGTQYWYWVKFNATGGQYNSGAATATRLAVVSCPTPSVVPYVQVGGTWSQTGSATVASGTSIGLGPQPIAGGNWATGTWSWSGCGTSGSSREQYFAPSASCTASAVFTDTCGQMASYNFAINTTAKWTNVKYGGGGYVPGLVFHPTTPDLLYARTDIGGSYRWDAAAAIWAPLTDGFGVRDGSHQGAESIALDPTDDRRVYMTTGVTVNLSDLGRLYISTDRGDNWQYITLPFPVGSNNRGRAIGERLMVDPNNPAILFYGSRTAGLWKSSDRGQNWQQVQSLASLQMNQSQIDNNSGGTPIGVQQVIFDTATSGSGSATQTIYTAIAPDYAALAGLSHSVFKSTNGGASWTGINTPLQGYHIPHWVRAQDGMMYVVFTKTTGPGADGPATLYKFDGTNWTPLKSYTQTEWTNYGIGGVTVSGTGSSTRIVLGITNSWGDWEGKPTVQISDDAGLNWREIGSATPRIPANEGFTGWLDDIEINPFNSEHILVVHGGGVWETKNASATKPTWNEKVNGIEEVATLALMTPPPGASYSLLNSSGDVGTLVHTDFSVKPTRNTGSNFKNGLATDMAWENPSYIATIGSAHWGGANPGAFYSTDSGATWNTFPTLHPQGLTNQQDFSSLAVMKANHVIWAPSNSVPAYTTNNGASWTYSNLPALPEGWGRSYRVVADRKNSNKVYAYDSGGGWWGPAPKFFTSTDGGSTFTASSQFASLNARPEFFGYASMAVNPNAEGHIWLVDGHSIFRSVDSGVTWTKLSAAASIWGSNTNTPEVYGATSIALGKAPAGSAYSAWVYVVGVIDGVWGLHRSEDGGNTWTRINDDKHQYAGMGNLAADHNVVGRVFFSGNGRGIFFTN